MRDKLLWCILVCGLVCLAAAPLHAQSNPLSRLKAELEQNPGVWRTSAPNAVVWRLTWDSFELLEGRLEVEIHDGMQSHGRYRTDDLVLKQGESTWTMTFPPLAMEPGMGEVELRARFVSPEREYNLGTYPVRVAPIGARSLSVAVADAWNASKSRSQIEVFNSFRFERFHPRANLQEVATRFAYLPPSGLPQTPLGCCSFDLVVLADEAFAQIGQKSLDVIRQWVDAGGSLVVLPGGGLRQHHEAFLNAFVAASEETTPLLVDDDGRLAPGQSEFRLISYGMGRVAVINRAPEGRNPNSAEWRRAVAFAWRMHGPLVDAVEQRGNWQGADAIVSQRIQQLGANPLNFRYGAYGAYMGFSTNGEVDFRQAPIAQRTWLLEHLMPESVRVVPLGLIALILLGYVAVIGPLDYFILGWFRARRFTWMLFPLVTVGFTLATVSISHHYLQASDERHRVFFVDVGAEGDVARVNRFELEFVGSPQTVRTDVAGEIFTPFHTQDAQSYEDSVRIALLRQQQFRQSVPPSSGSMVYPFDDADVDAMMQSAEYAGSFPHRYTVSQRLGQWTPQVNRFLSIGPQDERVKFDWKAAAEDVRAAPHDHTARQKLLAQVDAAFGAGASCWVLNGPFLHSLRDSRMLFVRQAASSWNDPFGNWTYMDAEFGKRNFLEETSSFPLMGMASLLSGVSPSGGPFLDDLAVLDAADMKQFLLVVAVERKNEAGRRSGSAVGSADESDGARARPAGADDLLIYRKLY